MVILCPSGLYLFILLLLELIEAMLEHIILLGDLSEHFVDFVDLLLLLFELVLGFFLSHLQLLDVTIILKLNFL